ncbi:hypothetical protein Pcinc_003678 [Petrolisthes cinctipes]|uniref:Uncharacterized protein n=1 Tax=Petrolisthes cinctipes TaxID=88211 RepID=A0AAE1GID6_PETCI|nr:hypothetical protein Pcinc_003678 [Petrolisthes cinctipes]
MAQEGDEAMVVLDGSLIPSTSRATSIQTYRQKRKQSGLWKEAQATCRVLILDFSDGNNIAGIRSSGSLYGVLDGVRGVCAKTDLHEEQHQLQNNCGLKYSLHELMNS